MDNQLRIEDNQVSLQGYFYSEKEAIADRLWVIRAFAPLSLSKNKLTALVRAMYGFYHK
jgi:hypothetical protein